MIRFQVLRHPDGHAQWRLLGHNNRSLAVGPRATGAAVLREQLARVRELAARAEATVHRRPQGGWTWCVLDDVGGVVAQSGAELARRADALAAVVRFRAAVPLAVLDGDALVLPTRTAPGRAAERGAPSATRRPHRVAHRVAGPAPSAVARQDASRDAARSPDLHSS